MRRFSDPAQGASHRGPTWHRRRWLIALLLSVLVHGLLVLWTVLTEKPEDSSADPRPVATTEDDRPIAVSLFDPTEGRPDGDVDAQTDDGDAPVSGTEDREAERVHRRRPLPQRPEIDDPTLPEVSEPLDVPDISAPPAIPDPSDLEAAGPPAVAQSEGDSPATPPGGADDHLAQAPEVDGAEPSEPADDPSDDPSEGMAEDSTGGLLSDRGLPVPATPGGALDAGGDGRSAPFPSPDGGPSIGGQGAGDPGSARLFDPDVIGRSVSRWRSSQPSREELMDAYGADDEDSPGAEQQRVSARLGRDIADANTMGEVRGGLLSSCNDGLDNNYDGWIDCGDPSCRAALPFCRNTVVLANLERRDIPDDHPGGVSSEIVVRHPGTVRALSVRIRVKHTSPGDLAVVLEHLDTNRTVVLRRTNRSERQYVSAFYTKDFNGGPVSGRWRLTVRDLVAGGTGYLEEWHLVITG